MTEIFTHVHIRTCSNLYDICPNLHVTERTVLMRNSSLHSTEYQRDFSEDKGSVERCNLTQQKSFHEEAHCMQRSTAFLSFASIEAVSHKRKKMFHQTKCTFPTSFDCY